MTLGRKQSVSHEDFVRAMENIEELVPRGQFFELFEKSVAAVRLAARGRRLAYAWSGGKDSQSLQAVCNEAGITECLMGISQLEYRAFLQWTTDNMPDELTILRNDWDLDWLVAHPTMLFPKDSATAGKWFSGVQHRAQRLYFKDNDVDGLLLGRRLADGNHCGKNGIYRDGKGVLRISPIMKWTHEDVLASIHYLKLPLPPFYGWPRGYRCGTHSWAARQWCRDDQHGWSEIWQIDQSIVTDAARRFDSAKLFLDQL